MSNRVLRNRTLRGIFRGRKATSGSEGPAGTYAGQVSTPRQQDGTGTAHDSVAPLQAAFAELVPHDQISGVSPMSNAAMGDLTSGGNNAVLQIPELFGAVSKNLDRLRAVTEAQTTTLGENTAAVTSNTAAKSASQVLASAGKTASGLLGGLGAFPLISGLMKLFGGGESTTQQPLQKYVAPASIRFDGSVQNDGGWKGFEASGYDRYGQARAVTPSVPTVPSYGQILAAVPTNTAGWGNGNTPEPPTMVNTTSDTQGGKRDRGVTQVTVNVQAMDSRSFLDRSGDIAAAVREAMLNMHSINDVVNDL